MRWPTRIPFPLLMLITDRRRCAYPDMVEAIRLAVEAGVGLVQLREKDLSAGELYELGLKIKDAVVGRAPLIINDRLDVALALGADGVHLGGSSLSVERVKSLVSKDFLVGCSVHSAEEALSAQKGGADYILAGPVFPTASKPGHPGHGTRWLSRITVPYPLVGEGQDGGNFGSFGMPVLAVGGITSDNLVDVLDAGAQGAAVISSILSDTDPFQAARRLVAFPSPVQRERVG